MGRANAGPDTDGTRFRVYTPRDGVPDENSGQNPRPVQFRLMNLRLLTGAQDPAGYEVLPVARVARSARAEAVPELHEPYIPPVLACDAWAVLQRGILQQVYHRVSKLVDQRSSQIRSRRITFDSQSPGDRQIFESLRVLNETSAHLGILADAAGVHPLPAYLELCRLVGRLAIFGPDAKPPDLPRYDHDDLGGCFFTVKRYIDELLSHGGFSLGYEERPFVGQGLRMKVTMEPAWLAPAWQIFVGVESPLPTADLVPLLTGRLNMKFGSIERVDEIFQRGLRGLAFAYNPKPPRALPESRTLTYFQVNRETSPDEWQNVQNSLAVAIRLNEKLIAGSIDGQNVVTIRTEGVTTTMQFTLYIVPQAMASKTGG
jgi:type VI secretion system protein ImpJ